MAQAVGMTHTEALSLFREWHLQAACRGFPNPDLWHSDVTGPTGAQITRMAKAICRRCPVQATCLSEHIDEPHGVWGGLDSRERREHRRRPTVHRPQCGTDQGYQWHQRRNEAQCGPCQVAHNARTQQSRRLQ